MSQVSLRSVFVVLQDLATQLVDTEEQRVVLRQRFLRHLEDEEHVLLQEVSGENDLLVYQKIKAAKQRLEDACIADIATICGNNQLTQTVSMIRKLCAQDLIKENEKIENTAHETTKLLSNFSSKAPPEPSGSWHKRLMRYFPIIKWTKNYKVKDDLPGDLFAGCTVAFMTFPQTMGYAMLAGLPPIYGLYAAFVPVFIYSILGTSAEMSVGPAAMVALMIPNTLSKFATSGTPEYILYATFLSFFSGAILYVAGMLNGGFIVENILSVPLLTGWIQGAAVLIVLSQMSGFLQITIPSTSNNLVSIVKSICEQMSSTNGWSALVGGVCLVLLFGSRKFAEHSRFKIIRKIPLSLIVLILVTVFTRSFEWHTRLSLSIIGPIPQGLPNFTFFSLTFELIQTSCKAAFIIAIIGFMEGISLAKKFSGMRKYRIDVSQELRALGLANMIGSCFKSFPVTGSVTRTTVNFQSGSRTTYSSIINGLLVGAVLLFLSPLFYYTPRTALAAIVISAGLSLVDVEEIRFLWRIGAKYDLAQLIATFLITLFTGPEDGAMFAIGISVIQIIYRATKPSCNALGPIAGTTVYQTGQYVNSTLKNGVLVIKIESGLFFYTMAWLKENLYLWENAAPIPLKAVVLDATSIQAIDSSGIHGLLELVEQYRKQNMFILFSNVGEDLYNMMDLAGLVKKAGADAFFPTVHEAVQVAKGVSYSECLRMTVVLN